MQIFAARSAPRVTRFIAMLTSAAFLGASTRAQVTPAGGQVTAGIGSISQTGATTTILQETQRLAIDWTTFSSAANEAIIFNQPNASAIALNRVTGSSPSELLGSLTANGQVFILNPNGVLFGAGSQVSAGGLVASTLSLTDADFLADNHRFSSSPVSGARTGSVVNQGHLTATPGGYIALLAPEVRNEGVITATLGTALLAAGNKLTLTIDNGSLLGYSIDQGAVQSLVSNHHLIQADGGQVLLSARAYDALATAAVNNTGVIEARTLQNKAGRILLLGDMQTGTVNLDGRLDASAPDGGDGGFIDTSAAHVHIADSTRVTTAAPSGRTGNWLIDPADYTIAASGGDISGATLSANLAGGNIEILSSSGANTSGNGDIHVNDTVSWSANTLTLTAARDININAVMTASGTSALVLNTATANGADNGVVTGRVNVGLAPNAGGFTGRVDFGARGGTGFLTINGNGYTVINSLGLEGSTTTTDLQGMAGNLTGFYALGANIDASATSTWNTNAGFDPIGNTTTSFSGGFDGLGHTVSNLTINRPGQNDVGLFGRLNSTVIGNIGLIGGSTAGNIRVGALAGQTNGGAVSHSYATGNVSATADRSGGLIGDNNNASVSYSYATGNVSAGTDSSGGLVGYNTGGIISHSYATGDVSTQRRYVGGLVGFNDGGTLSHVYATGDVTNTAGLSAPSMTGGLVGVSTAAGTITNAYATGNVTGPDATGGLIGYNIGAISYAYATGDVHSPLFSGGLVGRSVTGSSLNNVYATGTITGGTHVGGLAGQLATSLTNGYATGSVNGTTNVGGLVGRASTGMAITNTYATGLVTGTTAVGGLIGSYVAGPITSSYWNKDTTGQATSGGLAASFGKTTAELMQTATFTGWNLATTGGTSAVWRIYEGNTAPLLRSFLTPLTVRPDYDGSGLSMPNIASGSAVVAYDPANVFSTDTSTLRLASTGATGSYEASIEGLFSNQQGYDLSYSARTISTPGSAAGTVRLDNPITWTNGALILSATGSIDLNSFALISTGGALTLDSASAITNTATINVDTFVLADGTWSQLGGTLPFFLADDFRIDGGTFLRALGGDGTGGTPYQLTDIYGIQGMGSSGMLNKHFTLANNIDASGTHAWAGFLGFKPIGHGGAHFTGSLDGAGRVISGLVINRPIAGEVGLFGVNSGSLSNLDLVNIAVLGSVDVGGLVGRNDNGAISNASVTGYVSGTVQVGGLVGTNDNGSISHAYSTAATHADLGLSGGLVGLNDGSIDDAYATGSITGSGWVGGLVGVNIGNINNAYATGDLLGGDHIGGLVGLNDADGIITNAYATGNVLGAQRIGGLVGTNAGGSITNAYSTANVDGSDHVGGLVGTNDEGTITHTYATGSVTSLGSDVGGLVGFDDTGTITSSYWNKDTTGQAASAGLAATFGKTTAELRQASTFAGWDLATTGGSSAVWRIYEGNTAPLLRSFLTALTLTPDYDGSATPLTNIGSYSLPGGADGSKIFGTADYTGALTLSNTGAAGSHLASAPVSGLYSNQQGYDIASTASRTITTSGSAAGTVRLDNPITWTNGTLILSATGSIDLNNRALTGDRLQLTAGTTIANATAAVDANRFTLTAGTWSQINATLPVFSADDFRLTGGTFLRALGGNGTGGTPYQLTDLYGLQGIASSSLLGSSSVLANNIDASATSGWNAGAGFSPIGNVVIRFTGALDGLGHTVSNLTINRPGERDIGLFGLSSGTISNLGLIGGTFRGWIGVGTLSGRTFGGSISNVYATGNVSSTGARVGGLVGDNTNASISNSHATGNVAGATDSGGGLVGHNVGGSISNSYATGAVTVERNYGGGLIGYNTGSILNSYATGNVSATGSLPGSTMVGGLVGINLSGGTITNAYASGSVSGIDNSGGLVGYNEGAIANAYATGNVHATFHAGGLTGRSMNGGTLNNVYATGNITGVSNVGGLVGYIAGSLSNGYATGGVAGTSNVGGLAGIAVAGTAIGNTYATGPVTGTTAVGGLVGRYDAGTITSSYWNKDTTGQATSGGLAATFGKTTAELRQASTFAGWNLAATGGSSAVWRIYEGNTAPLLRSFLTPLTLTPDYDGSATPLTNIGSYSLPGGADGSKIFGTADYTGALTLSNTGATGSYLASAPVSGLYSNQQGYDIASTASRTITTTGSAAGTVRLDNPITWTNGTLILSATGSIDLNNRALTGDRLQLTAGTTIANATAAVDVNRFTLTAGTWSQINATLPTFSADDFRLTGGTFLRVLGGNGTGGTPYQLTDLYGLQGIASSSLLGSSSVLANNIDASATSGWNAGAGFAPIGNNATAFTGTFDGLGHTISGLTINRPGTDNIGLFGISTGTISNLGLIGGSLVGRNNVGGLAGQNQSGGSISNAYSTASVNATGGEAGGLVAINEATITGSYATGNAVAAGGYDAGGLVAWNRNGGTISNSYATGNASAALGYVGGLVGYLSDGTIDNSYATGNASTSAAVAGGLVGASESGTAISNSYATGNATSTDASGGLVGYNGGAIMNAYATGNVNATSYGAGGLVGRHLSGVITSAYATGSVTSIDRVGGLVGESVGDITHTYATGSVTGTTDVGGLIGQYNAGTITSSYWNKDTTGRATSAGLAATFGKTTAELRQAATFTGWNLATTGGSSAVWRIYEGNTGPLLRSFLTGLTLSNTTVTYNGTAQSGAAIATSGLLSGTAASGRNAGTYNAFSHQQGYDLTGGALTVTPASLVITTSDVTKTYDGGLSALGTAIATSGTSLFGSDTFSGGTFAFTDKNAGTGKTVTAAGVTVNDGHGGANYTVSYASNTASTITPRSLTATAAGVDKTYDGTTAATVSFADNRLLGDVFTLTGTAAFADKNAGTGKTVSVTGIGKTGTDAANYVLASPATTTTATITPKALTVAGLTAANKTYDGTTTATVSTTGASYTGLIAGDTVNVSATGLFTDKNAATNKSVVLASTYSGADAANYTITGQTAATATITPRSLTATAAGVNKTYDGTTATTVTFGDDRVLGDSLTLTGTAAFNDKNAGTGKTVFVTGIGKTGTDAANYVLAAPTTTTTATITPKALTVAGLTAANKTYDGTTTATVSTTSASYTGLIAGDTVNVSATGQFSDKNAATHKSVALTSTYSGADATNYTITGQTAATASITPKALIVTAANDTKNANNIAYTGGNGVTFDGFVAGETAAVLTGALTYTGSSQGALEPGLYTITPEGLASTNYTLTFTPGTLTIAAARNSGADMSEPYFSTLRYVTYVDTRVRERRDHWSTDIASMEQAAAEATDQH